MEGHNESHDGNDGNQGHEVVEHEHGSQSQYESAHETGQVDEQRQEDDLKQDGQSEAVSDAAHDNDPQLALEGQHNEVCIHVHWTSVGGNKISPIEGK